MASLTNLTPDSHGLIPDSRLYGHFLTHYKGGMYKIIGFAWLGATDEWGFLAIRHDAMAVDTAMVCRPLSHLTDSVADKPRYTMKDITRELVNAMMRV